MTDRGRIRRRWTILTLVICLAVPLAPTRADEPEAEAGDGLTHLDFLIGSWSADRVEFLNAEGEVVGTSSATAHNEFALDGQLLVHAGLLEEPEIATRGWYWTDRDSGQLRMGSVSSRGFYDDFVGGWEDGRLVMTTDSRATGPQGPLFRMIHEGIRADSYVESMNISNDGGRTWRASSRQVFRRARSEGARPAALDALGAYIGHWRSGDKTPPSGETFHFEIELLWLDGAETIARLVIHRVAPNDTTVVFEGYKGWDPDGGVYYFAVSASGRGARGEVLVEGNDLITLYDGWTADGDSVEIRDVFEPLEEAGDAFVSRTFLRQNPDDDWQQIGEDRWRRVEG